MWEFLYLFSLIYNCWPQLSWNRLFPEYINEVIFFCSCDLNFPDSDDKHLFHVQFHCLYLFFEIKLIFVSPSQFYNHLFFRWLFFEMKTNKLFIYVLLFVLKHDYSWVSVTKKNTPPSQVDIPPPMYPIVFYLFIENKSVQI